MNSCEPTQTFPPKSSSNAELVSVIATKLDLLHKDMGELRNTQEKMADAITRFAVIEERQTAMMDAVKRAFNTIDEVRNDSKLMEIRIRNVETTNATNTKVSRWIEMGLLGIAVVVFQAVSKQVGLGG